LQETPVTDVNQVLSREWGEYFAKSSRAPREYEAALAGRRSARRGRVAALRKLAKKDPERPRRPPTAFALFLADGTSGRSAEASQSSQQSAQRWMSLSVEAKSHYEQDAADLKRAYDEQMAKYKASCRAASWKAMIMRHLGAFHIFYAELKRRAPSITEIAAWELWGSLREADRGTYADFAERRRASHKAKPDLGRPSQPMDPEMPRRPRNAWLIFRAAAKLGTKAASARWRSMTDAEQGVYRSRAVAEKEAYEKQMAERRSSGKAAS